MFTVVSQDDFEQFLWTVVFLAMGGIALGKGVESSGLLVVMDEVIRKILGDLSLYGVVMVLSAIVLVRLPRIRVVSMNERSRSRIGGIYVHQPHHRSGVACTHCQCHWREAGCPEPTCLPDRFDMLCGYGYACLRIP